MGNNKHTDGLTYRKLDLHIHSPGSDDFDNKSVTGKQIVDEALAKGLVAIAITDHNNASFVEEVQSAAKSTSLTVFPGVELTCSGGKGGVHVIALFDTNCGKADIEGLLAELGLLPQDYGDLNKVIGKSVSDVLSIISRRRGLGLLAHANTNNGFFNEVRGQERKQVAINQNLYGVELTDFQSSGNKTCEYFDGSCADYDNRVLGVYQASDNPSSTGGGHGLAGIGARCSYFKLDKVNLESLRQCFTDPKVRIRQSDCNNLYPRIVDIKVTGGFFDGESAKLHTGLNSIIGGKGAGKSLLIEFMRFVLKQPSSIEQVYKDHQKKLEAKLDTYSYVELIYEDAVGKQHVVKRTYSLPEGHPIEGDDVFDIEERFPVLFLSQNEIIYIADDPTAQLDFIDQFFNFHHHKLTIADLERQISEWDTKLANAIRALQEINDVNKLIAGVTKELQEIEQHLKNPIFDNFQKLEQIRLQLEEYKTGVNKIIGVAKSTSGDEDVLGVKDLPEQFSTDPMLLRAKEAHTKSVVFLTEKLLEVEAQTLLSLSNIEKEEIIFSPKYEVAKHDYEEEVRNSGGDQKVLATKRAQKTLELNQLTNRKRQLHEKSKMVGDIVAGRKALLDKLQTAYGMYTAERQEKIKTIELKANGKLRLSLSVGDNKEVFRHKLQELKKGSYLKDSEISNICAKIEPYDFIGSVLNYMLNPIDLHIQKLATIVELELDRVKTLVEFLTNSLAYEDLLKLQYKAMPQDIPLIEYNVTKSASELAAYQPLDMLSTGQKCTAMLIVALSDGIMPIVIDQPEDSLDIRSVWEDMCTKIRSNKENRQFIFTTHNSSLAVASDTDKFLIIEGNAQKGRVAFSGSMDNSPVSDEVLKYLEGGKDAYHKKYSKYGVE